MTQPTSPSIPPALTAEEWRRYFAGEEVVLNVETDPDLASSKGALVERRDDGSLLLASQCHSCGMYDTPLHSLAALALHGQPYGFTWEDVEHLRLVAGQPAALHLGINHGYVLRELADRIAALLPPRDGAA